MGAANTLPGGKAAVGAGGACTLPLALAGAAGVVVAGVGFALVAMLGTMCCTHHASITKSRYVAFALCTSTH